MASQCLTSPNIRFMWHPLHPFAHACAPAQPFNLATIYFPPAKCPLSAGTFTSERYVEVASSLPKGKTTTVRADRSYRQRSGATRARPTAVTVRHTLHARQHAPCVAPAAPRIAASVPAVITTPQKLTSTDQNGEPVVCIDVTLQNS